VGLQRINRRAGAVWGWPEVVGGVVAGDVSRRPRKDAEGVDGPAPLVGHTCRQPAGNWCRSIDGFLGIEAGQIRLAVAYAGLRAGVNEEGPLTRPSCWRTA
jgi:hypothetical protein